MKPFRTLLSLFLVLALFFSLTAPVLAADAASSADPSAAEETASAEAASGSWIVVILCVLGGILVLGVALVLIVKKFSDAN